ncbi:LacI family transcriptional regulator [Pedobacter steynii]|uniref:LacI family transcriptional regulator n=1 Tax=Pedobacter steynii TaxID=430522 RepID=A0A1G9UTL8_9SPHI|nr:LacI family DNA-binding transcriptional regulator [Pedobacter steynii]NQX40872.1 LacI family DNA-binding transcriptional regulator [Pedobacter steynii]SDM63213.1 LacI family transcriptional regulator [Pedobacter steynii]
MKKLKRVTIYDIAEKLNLNPSSVSRALNNGSNVSLSTRELILKTAEEMNYKVNSIAANLRTGHNQTIGVIVPRINQNFFANVIAGIEEVTYEKGYNLVICQSNESADREIKCVNTLANQHVSCIIISVSADFEDYAHLENIRKQGISLIQFDRVADELDTMKVVNDNEKVSMEAVCHMISEGYQRIALLEGPQNLSIFRQRKAGYLAALKKYKLPVIPELIMENAWTTELGAAATKHLLALAEPPDAIFASTSDFSALGVLEVADELGIQVPQQLGICGYSNESFTQITNPSITTIEQNSVLMGKTIAQLYFDELESGTSVAQNKLVNIQPELIIRNSTLKLSR